MSDYYRQHRRPSATRLPADSVDHQRDRDGIPVGVVTDLRCVQDGPPQGARAALRVDALLVSRHHTGALLGYDESRSQCPALFRAVMRRLRQDARTIPCDRVVRHGGEAVELDLRRDDLGVRSRRRRRAVGR